MSTGIFEAYAAGRADAFFASHFARAEDRARARGVARPIAPALADALERQNARYEPSARRDAHLLALRRGAAAVVTGQQVGLLLGPLYTLYKAATTVRLARALSAEWGAEVVPVFWLQTEDHDLPEIARCHVARSRGEPLCLTLPAPRESISVAHRVLPLEIAECLDRLTAELAHEPHAQEHLARLARHYRPGAGWSAAFAGVLSELFGEEGLVLIDPRDPALAELAAPVHRRALLEARPMADSLRARVAALEAAGVAATVHVREAAPLSFFHPDGPEGRRFRLEPSPGGFSEVGGERTHTLAALLAALDSRPASFSTSALLRPILQDTWLPTATYVGGPAEVAYFAQLAPLYAAFELSPPLVVPRARLRLLEPSTRRLLARRHLTAPDVCHPVDDVLARARAGGPDEPGGDAVSQRLLESFDSTLRDLEPVLRKAGGGIEKALGKTRGTVARAVGRLAGKYEKARLHRDADLMEDVLRLQGWLYPAGQPQERHYGISYFASRHGERAFVQRVLAAAEPLEVAQKDVEL